MKRAKKKKTLQTTQLLSRRKIFPKNEFNYYSSSLILCLVIQWIKQMRLESLTQRPTGIYQLDYDIHNALTWQQLYNSRVFTWQFNEIIYGKRPGNIHTNSQPVNYTLWVHQITQSRQQRHVFFFNRLSANKNSDSISVDFREITLPNDTCHCHCRLPSLSLN